MSNLKTAISPTRSENYPEWYQQVIKAADLAELAPVRGCMVIKPWGYALWENIQRVLDKSFKETGHKNVYFPLLIPKEFFEREAKHIEGFAKEVAIVTHHRLVKNEEGKLVPDSPLEEPLIIRPTSEVIIGEVFSKWIQSYRDLPLLVNQWANIIRWEMRTRIFLRTMEFLWQEGHTAHSTAKEAQEETLKMLDVYHDFAESYMAIPVIKGEKTEGERFPGAVATYCIEAMMQDKKALQCGTSHFLGQNFSKAFNIKFLNADGVEEYAWTTSWGVSTRLIGGLIMVHSDDNGLVLPPRLAPVHVVIIPTPHKMDERELLVYCEEIESTLRKLTYHDQPLIVEIDRSENNASEKGWTWYKKGVPIRLEIGPREFQARTVCMGRRDHPYREKTVLPLKECAEKVVSELDEIQKGLYERARNFQESNSIYISSKSEFYEFFNPARQNGGFVYAFWKGDVQLEDQLKKELSVTIRCLPLEKSNERGECIFTGQKEGRLAVFAKAY